MIYIKAASSDERDLALLRTSGGAAATVSSQEVCLMALNSVIVGTLPE